MGRPRCGGERESWNRALCPSSNSPNLAKGGWADGKGLHERGREDALPGWLFLAQARAPGGKSVRTHAHSLPARPGSGEPRWHAARLEWTGGPFQSQEGLTRAHSAAECRATCASSHPRRLPALGARSPSRSHAPWTGPLGCLRARRSSQVSGSGVKGHKAKGAKRRRRRGRGQGLGSGVDTKRAGKALGVARGL